jgi:hypothetical protein
LNGILSIMMFLLFIVVSGALLSEIFDCTISLVPSCS